MHIRMIYKLASERTLDKLFIYIATIFLCFTAFVLLLVSVFAWCFVTQGKTVCDKCLSGGLKQAGTFEIETFDVEYDNQIRTFIEEAARLDGITGIGYASVGGNNEDCLADLISRQGQLTGRDDSYFYSLSMNWEGASVCHFELQEGKLPQEYEKKDGVILLYIGSNYLDIPVGTTWEVAGEDKYTYYVAGILKEGMKWISEEIYIGNSIVDTCYIENLDNGAISVGDDIHSARITYTVKEGYNVKEAEVKLQELAEQNGLKLSFAILEDVIKEIENRNSYIFRAIQKVLLFIIITVILLLICTQMTQMLEDMRYFGILYANGASTKDLICILFGENLLKIALSYFLAVFVMYFVIKHEWSIYQPGAEAWKTAVDIYCWQTVIPVLGISILLTLFTTAIPVLWLKSKSPTELMEGYEV